MATPITDATPDVVADRRVATADGSWMLWSAIALSAIWVGVVLISVFAPDLVTGVQQEHLPVAALVSWLWGLGGTVGILVAMNRLRGRAERRPIWIGLAIAVIAIWVTATLAGVLLPTFESGTDPTQLPFAAILAPLAAAMLTALAGFVAVEFAKGPKAE